MKSVKTEADVVAARAEWNNLCDEAKGFFEDKQIWIQNDVVFS